MAQGDSKKEALFNEVKGSLFEYLVAKNLAQAAGEELSFHQGLDANYLSVLSQQDRMIRQFYPEMLPFLSAVASQTTNALVAFLKTTPHEPRLMGKFSNSALHEELDEADLLIKVGEKVRPVSLKLNKKNAFVNTKSGGIRSFFTHYFPFLPAEKQREFDVLVDREFTRMSAELYECAGLEFDGGFKTWVMKGRSELPGELTPEERDILKRYYARIAASMHEIMCEAQRLDPEAFGKSLAPLMGFGKASILQVVCFHDFDRSHEGEVVVHPFEEISDFLTKAEIHPFGDIASVEISVGTWALQIRVKPMNKFTTTAIKINCSVKVL